MEKGIGDTKRKKGQKSNGPLLQRYFFFGDFSAFLWKKITAENKVQGKDGCQPATSEQKTMALIGHLHQECKICDHL